MTGIVLCGGQSLRMGADKGLMKSANESWAQIAFNKLAAFNIPVYLSINENQLHDYEKEFPEEILLLDDSMDIKGPLLGLLTAYKLELDEDIFLLACDMPLMDSSILQQLVNEYDRNDSPDAFVFTTDGEAEPLCGIYKSTGLEKILTLYRSRQLTKNSMKFILDHINTVFIPLQEEQKKYFTNVNAQTDLESL